MMEKVKVAICRRAASPGPVSNPVRSGREGEGCRNDLSMVVALPDSDAGAPGACKTK